MKIFFDTEFTGLHQDTTLISIGLIDEDGRCFYAELDDYDKTQVDQWINDNVIKNLRLADKDMMGDLGANVKSQINAATLVRGEREFVAQELSEWLSFYDEVEMWSDVLAYDWVLFCELFTGAMSVPSHVYYIPFDLATFMKLKGVDPDVDREKFSDYASAPDNRLDAKHNALHDAKVIRACYKKLS